MIRRGVAMAGPKKEIQQDELVKRFGNRLREVRLSRGMTQAELAEKAEVSPAYVGRLERGGATPGIDLVGRLAKALGTTLADLLPESAAPDAVAVLREQSRRLFESVIQTEDQATLSLLAQVLTRLVETGAIDR
jgi:transcriptional regulator with XRE-family HTH domain